MSTLYPKNIFGLEGLPFDPCICCDNGDHSSCCTFRLPTALEYRGDGVECICTCKAPSTATDYRLFDPETVYNWESIYKSEWGGLL